MLSGLARFGLWLRVRRNYLLFSVLAFGGTLAVVLIAWLSGYGYPLPYLVLVVVPVCVVAGYVWGLAMFGILGETGKDGVPASAKQGAKHDV